MGIGRGKVNRGHWAHTATCILSTLDTPHPRASRLSEGPSGAYVCDRYEEPEVELVLVWRPRPPALLTACTYGASRKTVGNKGSCGHPGCRAQVRRPAQLALGTTEWSLYRFIKQFPEGMFYEHGGLNSYRTVLCLSAFQAGLIRFLCWLARTSRYVATPRLSNSATTEPSMPALPPESNAGPLRSPRTSPFTPLPTPKRAS